LIPALDRLCREFSVSISDIDGLGVAVGPGSFSGIRVGLATVKGISIAGNLPIAGVGSLDCVAAQALEPGETGLALMDAKRSEVYAARMTVEGEALRAIDAPSIMSVDRVTAYVKTLPGDTVLCCDEMSREAVANVCGNGQLRVVPVSAAVCGLLAAERLSRGANDPLHAVAPVYIRRSDAEEKMAR
jgi:tRNA threonylcarbamoyl adenosine modification protein YeaZ